MQRRRFLTLAGTTLAGGFCAQRLPRLWGVPPQASPGFEAEAGRMVQPPIDGAIDRGLAYLSQEQRDDGSLGVRQYEQNVAVVGLSGMAWMAGGSMPRGGPYSENVNRAIDFILDHVGDDGYIQNPDGSSHGPMYGHGFATMFLAECHGTSLRDDLAPALERAVALILDTQNDEGGWRYYPQRLDADVSVTVCQIMALRAARNVGVFVPAESMNAAVDYVKQCQNADGGFRYMLEGDASSRFPRSAAGVVALYSAGIYEGEEIELGLDYLARYLPRAERAEVGVDAYYFYGQYYASQAMWHAGGDRWRDWYPAMAAALLDQQEENGSWPDLLSVDYATAMACLALQIPNNLLSIFQR